MLLDCGSPNRPGFRSSAAKGDLARKVGLTTVSSFEFLVSSFRFQVSREQKGYCFLRARNSKHETIRRWPTTNDQELFTVQLDNQLLVDRQLNIFTLGQRQNASLVVVAINLQPVRKRLMAGEFLRDFQYWNLLAVFADGDLFALAHLVRRNVDLASIHGNMAVTHQLARLASRNGKAQPVDNIVQPPLQL